jgi:hypothetical protein
MQLEVVEGGIALSDIGKDGTVSLLIPYSFSSAFQAMVRISLTTFSQTLTATSYIEGCHRRRIHHYLRSNDSPDVASDQDRLDCVTRRRECTGLLPWNQVRRLAPTSGDNGLKQSQIDFKVYDLNDHASTCADI